MESNQQNSLIINNRYQIREKLSHKTGRQTLLAKDAESQELVIIKILQFDSLFQWDDLKLFEREAKTLENLNHSAIPKYLDYFEVDNEQIRGFALVQTYIDAPSLEDAIQQGRKFTEAELIELAQKLLKILDYLHSYNPPIIHRDIKPSNILISNRTGNSIGELYLVDFGSVQTAASKGEGTITIVGTYGYIPLEQFGGQTTAASDLYSLGMTLIYIITGVHPAELPQDNGRVEFQNSQIGNGLQRWLIKMTEPYLNKRFDSAKSAQTALLNKEQSSGSFLHLKPSNSKIRLNRYQHKLEIVFRKQIIIHKYFYGFDVVGCLVALSITILILLLQFTWLIWLPYLIFEVWLLIKIAKSAFYVPSLIHYEIISISKNKSVKRANYYDKKPKQLKWRTVINAEEKLHLIVYNPGYVFNKFVDNARIKNDFRQVRVPQQLSLHADEQEYTIGNGQQSKAELFWLGKEISDFLSLELAIYPTPKIVSNR